MFYLNVHFISRQCDDLWLLFAWYIFFHPFIFNFSVFLYLRYLCHQHITWSLKNPTEPILIGKFRALPLIGCLVQFWGCFSHLYVFYLAHFLSFCLLVLSHLGGRGTEVLSIFPILPLHISVPVVLQRLPFDSVHLPRAVLFVSKWSTSRSQATLFGFSCLLPMAPCVAPRSSVTPASLCSLHLPQHCFQEQEVQNQTDYMLQSWLS